MGEQVAARSKFRGSKEEPLNGGLAQLGEHLPCKQGVESSNLLVSIEPLAVQSGRGKISLLIVKNRRVILPSIKRNF